MSINTFSYSSNTSIVVSLVLNSKRNMREIGEVSRLSTVRGEGFVATDGRSRRSEEPRGEC